VSRLLQVVFAAHRKIGQVELEAIEMLVRDSMHGAGAAVLDRLLSMPAPQPSQVPVTVATPRNITWPCG